MESPGGSSPLAEPRRAIHIITDSCAHLPDPQLLEQYPITVVPNKIEIGGKVYQEGVDLSPEEALRLISRQNRPPVVTSPSEADFLRAYNKVARSHQAIISIHASREMYSSWNNGRRAAQQLSGSAEIAVIDSRSLCLGQGLLVELAAKLAAGGIAFEHLVRQVRGAVDRVYAVYCVETVDYLLYNHLISSGHGILSAMLAVKPFLTVEEGRLVAIEKVRSRAQTVERIYEFVAEFDGAIDRGIIVQPKTAITEQTRMLQERLQVELPDQPFPFSLYGASLAALIGADASGFVLMESEETTGQIDDDFSED